MTTPDITTNKDKEEEFELENSLKILENCEIPGVDAITNELL